MTSFFYSFDDNSRDYLPDEIRERDSSHHLMVGIYNAMGLSAGCHKLYLLRIHQLLQCSYNIYLIHGFSLMSLSSAAEHHATVRSLPSAPG